MEKIIERGEDREREKSKNREKEGGKSFKILSINRDQRQRIKRREERT